MSQRTSVEVQAQAILDWIETNNTTATSVEIEQALQISHSSCWRALWYLQEHALIRPVNPLVKRNVQYEATGKMSKMPKIKDDNDNYIPITTAWHAFVGFAKKSPDKFLASFPKHLAYVAITRYFYAAIQAQMNDTDNAKQTLAAARRVLFQARKNAVRDLALIDRLLADPKLNPNHPRGLIAVLLEDKENPVDVYKMWNDDAQYLIKMVGNKA